jgi:hypothetical protein
VESTYVRVRTHSTAWSPSGCLRRNPTISDVPRGVHALRDLPLYVRCKLLVPKARETSSLRDSLIFQYLLARPWQIYTKALKNISYLELLFWYKTMPKYLELQTDTWNSKEMQMSQDISDCHSMVVQNGLSYQTSYLHRVWDMTL